MSDAWSIQISGDTNSMGWTTVVSATAGLFPDFSPKGEIISESVNNLHFIPENVKTYSEAKKLIEEGSKTALINKEPIIYVSLPANRKDTWGYFSENFVFPNLKIKNAQDDFGLGGWTALSIIDDLKTGKAFEYDSAFSSFDYDVSYFRVNSYGNVIQEFSTLFSGLPIVLSYDASGKITAKLAPFASTVPDLATGNITVKYIPKKKPCVIVYGGWGPPTSDANTSTPTSSYSKKADINNLGDLEVYWGRGLPMFSSDVNASLAIDDGAKIDLNALFTGVLNIYASDIESQYIKQIDIDVDNKAQGFQGEMGIVVSRTEVVVGGMPLFTLVNKTETKDETLFLSDTTESGVTAGREGTSVVVTANVGSLVSGGENALDLHPVTNYIIHTSVRPAWLVETEGGDPVEKIVVSGVSITYTTYEDMFSSDRKVIASGGTGQPTTSAAVGRKSMEESFEFKLFVQDKDEFDGGKRVEAEPVDFSPIAVNSRSLDKNKLVLYPTNVRKIQYHPIGATGFSRSIQSIVYNPTSGTANVEVSDGSGDSGQYISQLQFGPGATRVRASAGDGDPDHINLGFCSSWDKAQEYADNALDYRDSYYEITATTQKTACPEPDFEYPTEIPGTNGDYGLIMSVSKNITPTKSYTTVIYRYYE